MFCVSTDGILLRSAVQIFFKKLFAEDSKDDQSSKESGKREIRLDRISVFRLHVFGAAAMTMRVVYSIDKRVNKKPRFDNQTLKIDENRKGN